MNDVQYVVCSEYYGEEASMCQVDMPTTDRAAAEARADEVRSWGRSNEVEVRRLSDCLANGIS